MTLKTLKTDLRRRLKTAEANLKRWEANLLIAQVQIEFLVDEISALEQELGIDSEEDE